MAVAVVGPDGVIDQRGPADERRPFASVTKLFSALALHVATEEGTVGLADPAGPAGSTLAHLLAHASGVAPDDPGLVLAPPGTRRIYANAGYELAAAHLERASGVAFADYLAEGVLGPLGTRGVRLEGSPAAGATGTLGDLELLGVELLAPRLLHPETARRLSAVAFPGIAGVVPGFGRFAPCDWGLGPEIADGKAPHWTGTRRSPASFGHFGQSGSFVLVEPEIGVALCVLCEVPFGPWATATWPVFVDAVLAELGA